MFANEIQLPSMRFKLAPSDFNPHAAPYPIGQIGTVVSPMIELRLMLTLLIAFRQHRLRCTFLVTATGRI
jgi:hypothetical protein